jgi:ABC-type uncharacterized transport system involved in gliding motility auxiliary subunit
VPLSPPSKAQLWLVNVVFVLLLLAAIGLLQWLSTEYHLRFDWTRGSKNSLSDASVEAVRRLDQPVTITAFASQRQNLRASIRELLGRYQRYKPDIVLEFVDPDTDPERVRKADVRFDGEVIVEYGESRETLTRFDEETITNAFVRLGHAGERWLVFLGGHGERSPDGQANFDLSSWTAQLLKRGFAARVITLAENPQLPRNTTALVLAGPRIDLLPGEIAIIEGYIAGGGNLLWLADPEPLRGLATVAESLGIEFEPGIIVDPASEAITGNATAIVGTHYGSHPIVEDFRNITLFLGSVGIRLGSSTDWQATVLLDTRDSAWAETSPLTGPARLDKDKDIAGPLILAVALTRKLGDIEQRVVVIGDGDFLSNRFLGNGVNLEFGMSIANWISRDDRYVNIPVMVTLDRSLDLTRTSQLVIGGGFLFFLPLLLVISGTVIWLRRRRR